MVSGLLGTVLRFYTAQVVSSSSVPAPKYIRGPFIKTGATNILEHSLESNKGHSSKLMTRSIGP